MLDQCVKAPKVVLQVLVLRENSNAVTLDVEASCHISPPNGKKKKTVGASHVVPEVIEGFMINKNSTIISKDHFRCLIEQEGVFRRNEMTMIVSQLSHLIIILF